jgi:hypothetical protein
MSLESATYLDGLVGTNPPGGDAKAQGDDHIRLIKNVLKATLPGLAGRAWRHQNKSGAYTVVATDNMTVLNCTAALTLDLTAAATLGNGHLFIARANGGAVTIDPASTEQINGGLTLVVADGSAALVFCSGSAFFALAAELTPSNISKTLIDAKGDLIVGTSADTPARKAAGANGTLLMPDSGAADGLSYVQPPFQFVANATLAFSTATGALTCALKTQDGGDPADGDPIYVSFRHATASNGGYNVRRIAAALSLVLSSGSTLGHGDNVAGPIYHYLIDFGGTVEYAVSNKFHGYFGIISTTAEGGAGAADSQTVMYSASARTDVPFVCIGRSRDTQTTAGTWAANPDLVELAPFPRKAPTKQVFTSTGANTYTKPWDLLWAKVQVQAGGGGSGGNDDTVPGVSGAGGGGGYTEKLLDASTIGPTETATVGAGGIAGTSGGGAGGTGGTSSFGSHCSATGGGGGAGMDAGAPNGSVGIGGTGTGGDFSITGGAEYAGASTSSTLNRTGGSAHLGFGGRQETNGSDYGGGAGGRQTSGGGPEAGSVGGKGIVIVEEHYV